MGTEMIKVAVEHFFEWATTECPINDPRWTVQDYAIHWLESAEGAVERVAGKYTIFLKVLVVITQECYNNPSVLNQHKGDEGNLTIIPRRPRFVPYEERQWIEEWADQDQFDQLVYDWNHKTGVYWG